MTCNPYGYGLEFRALALKTAKVSMSQDEDGTNPTTHSIQMERKSKRVTSTSIGQDSTIPSNDLPIAYFRLTAQPPSATFSDEAFLSHQEQHILRHRDTTPQTPHCAHWTRALVATGSDPLFGTTHASAVGVGARNAETEHASVLWPRNKYNAQVLRMLRCILHICFVFAFDNVFYPA